MGFWDIKLYTNDIASDVRDTYIDFLKQQFSNEKAYQKTCEEYSELMGTDEEPLFWYALADTQWKFGRLQSEVKQAALKCIRNKGGIDFWEEDAKKRSDWKKILQSLEKTLLSPMPKEKKINKPIEFKKNPWNIGDIYAYQFHTKKAVESGLYEKYILFQKIGNVEYFKGVYFSVVQVFNQVFDYIPSLEEIKDLKIMPLIYSPITHSIIRNISEYVPSLEWYMKAAMIYEKKNDYPKNHLTFIGNIDLPEKKYTGNSCTSYYWHRNNMEDWLSSFYLSWENMVY